MSERKRKLEEEASSTSVSPLNKKTKLNDSSDSSPDSHDVIVFAASSSSIASSAALASDECSVTTAGEENDQSSSISSGCFTSESKRIAKNSSSFGVDLETHEIKTETETETFINNNFRKETSPVSEGLGETTTEMESSSATERKQPKVSKTPTPTEIEDFFSELENDSKKRFIEKYNFDIVNDEPLEGRYKWDRL
ncbi:Cyclin-dependent kinase inhibitor [Arabidopsis thaliana x Arabidopsis arenosa]|uniref:Cyclin-dependent kinase inhibitor n=1 Tax=Arabidopsis thaliana x Arabidopsis arenosa TaxID=1240361 RepID=A0A8T2AX60_9BRAS|nr:Cyclin-dependent kinase inhibitor [Arabidopsis thaliana x Arabidopsis arenosa]